MPWQDYYCEWFCGCPRYRIIFHLGVMTEQVGKPPPNRARQGKTGVLMAAFSMTDSQQTTMTVSFTDKKGNPAPTPAGAQPPAWLVDQPTVLTLTPAADGLSCVVSAVGPLGTATVSVKVSDAAGNPLASGSLAVTIVGGAPTQVTVTPGTPTEQP